VFNRGSGPSQRTPEETVLNLLLLAGSLALAPRCRILSGGSSCVLAP
jgi:hypothetical protein